VKVGFVEGAGTSTSPRQYSLADKDLAPGRYAYRIKQIDMNGSFQYSLSTEVTVGSLPLDFSLAQNYPNPFNPSTTIRYALPERSRVRLDIYNLLGQRVQTLVDQEVEAGYQTVVWDAQVSTGLYFYQIEAVSMSDANRKFIEVKKMILVR